MAASSASGAVVDMKAFVKERLAAPPTPRTAPNETVRVPHGVQATAMKISRRLINHRAAFFIAACPSLHDARAELKESLTAAGIPHKHCLERAELEHLYTEWCVCLHVCLRPRVFVCFCMRAVVSVHVML